MPDPKTKIPQPNDAHDKHGYDGHSPLELLEMMGEKIGEEGIMACILGGLGKVAKFPKLGYRGSKPYRDALKKIKQGGEKVDLGFTPTEQQAKKLLEDAGIDMSKIRTEGPHRPPNPHTYPHINYPTPGGGRGTIPIQ